MKKPRVFREATRGILIAAHYVYSNDDDAYKSITRRLLNYCGIDASNKLHMKLLEAEFEDDAEVVKQLLSPDPRPDGHDHPAAQDRKILPTADALRGRSEP